MFNVFVIPGAKKTSVEREGEVLRVHLAARPEKGKANKELVEVLSEYFSVKKTQIRIISGLTSRKKKIQILGQ